jgi:hypothetical protein
MKRSGTADLKLSNLLAQGIKITGQCRIFRKRVIDVQPMNLFRGLADFWDC